MKEPDRSRAARPERRKLPHAVFISYSSNDTNLANSICAALEADSIPCWIARWLNTLLTPSQEPGKSVGKRF